MSDTQRNSTETRQRRALFRATHRGTKEMDWMIGRFAVAKLPGMDKSALDRFELLLDVTDVELDAWLMKARRTVTPEFEAVIADIRQFHAL